MSRIFISHSSRDNASAAALAKWLHSKGWDDVFLDTDPERGIAAGESWERALNQAALRCEAVLFLVSRAWLGSDWCIKEFNLAHRLNKRLFGLLIEDIPLGELPVTLTSVWQLVQLNAGRDHVMITAELPVSQLEVQVTFSAEGLKRLKSGLERAGLDARFFEWPPPGDLKRSPYPGLRPLQPEDAGIFFGREAPTIESLDRLRGMRDGNSRLLVILGASGAGKSSFLRAGLWPRLARDDRHFLPLPILRPERAALSGSSGLLHVLEQAFAQRNLAVARADIRAAIEAGAAGVRTLLTQLVDAPKGGPPEEAAAAGLAAEEAAAETPIPLLAIDQGEELFLPEGAAESEALRALLKDLIEGEKPGLMVIVTVRSDSYEKVQTASSFADVPQQALSLPPIPRGAYQLVIEGPAARAVTQGRALAIEPALTQALLSDIEDGAGSDALPLLAFTLERLFLEYGARGRLQLADYERLGRIRGSIEAAVERAMKSADERPDIPRDPDERLRLLKQGLIPWLAGVDPETGSPRRRVARRSEIPAESLALIDLLVEQRLLSRDVAKGTSEPTIEPAHEALLRQWQRLRDWLADESVSLATLETVARAARDWAANGRQPDWLNHSGGRLQEAVAASRQPALVGYLGRDALAYLADCQTAELDRQNDRLRRQEQEREEQERRIRDAEALARADRRTAAITRRWLAAAAVLLALSLAAAAVAGWQWTIAQSQTARAIATREDSAEVARLARSELSDTNDKLRSRLDDLLKWASPGWGAALHHWRAAAYETARDFPAERRDLNAEAIADGDFAPRLIASSDNHVMEGDAERAIDDVQQALKLGAADSLLYGNLALAKAMQRDYAGAIAAVDQALAHSQRTLDVTESLVAPEVQEFTSGFKLWVRYSDYSVALRYEKAALLAMSGDAGFASALDQADKADRDAPFSRTAYLEALNWEWLILRGQNLADARRRRAAQDSATPGPIKDYGAFAVESALWRRIASTRPDYRARATNALAKFEAAFQAAPRDDYAKLRAWALEESKRSFASVGEPASPLDRARDLEVRARERANGPNSGAEPHRMAPAMSELSDAIALLDAKSLGRRAGRREEDEEIGLLLQRGQWKLSAQDPGGAADDARAVLAIDGDVADAHRLLGDASVIDDDRRREYQEALRLNPGDAGALAGLSEKLESAPPAEAIDGLLRLRHFRRWEAGDLQRLAALQMSLGRADDALGALAKAANVAPWDGAAMIQRHDIEKTRDAAGADLHLVESQHDQARFFAATGENARALDAFASAFRKSALIEAAAPLEFEQASLFRDFDRFLVSTYGPNAATQWWRSVADNPLASEREKALANAEAQRLEAKK